MIQYKYLAFVFFIILFACKAPAPKKNVSFPSDMKKVALTKENLYGKWMQPIPGEEDESQGFVLHKDYTAGSLNIHTLLYERWALSQDTLFLWSHTQGVSLFSENIDTLLIKKLTERELIIAPANAKDVEERYIKEK
ncbi:hypothetical protein CMV00_14115 [Elizabethkingia anophelis]|nr:hypothetical protein [Elizabethkingia anophelis]